MSSLLRDGTSGRPVTQRLLPAMPLDVSAPMMHCPDGDALTKLAKFWIAISFQLSDSADEQLTNEFAFCAFRPQFGPAILRFEAPINSV